MRTLDKYNPITAAVYFFSVSGIAMFSMNPVLLLISLCCSVSYYVVRNGGKSAGVHLFSAVLFFIMATVNPLVYHNGVTVLFVLNDNPVTLQAATYGLAAACMVVSVLYWFRSFSEIMTSDKLLYLFGKLSPKLALVLSMGLRYVPLFKKQAKRIENTQKALGLYRDDNLIDRFRGGIRVFSVLLTWALENGIITADSMSARGYGTGKRSHFSVFRMRRADVVFLLVTLGLFALTVFSIGVGALDFIYYPSLKAAGMSSSAISGYIAYCTLALLPTLTQTEERIRWKYLRSKI